MTAAEIMFRGGARRVSLALQGPSQASSDGRALVNAGWLDARHLPAFLNLQALLGQLDDAWRVFVAEILGGEGTLQAFLNRPASLNFHHNWAGGLLTHTVDVAVDCAQVCDRRPDADRSLTIAAALLHDVGKCIEYEPCRYGFRRSAAGEREMHKTLGVRMIERAAQRCHATEPMVSRLVHCVVAANGPDYMGLPRLKMLEAVLLQTADARSAFIDPTSRWTEKVEQQCRPMTRAEKYGRGVWSVRRMPLAT